MMRDGRRGQMALFGIMALSMVVLVVFYLQFAGREAEVEANQQERRARELGSGLEKVQQSIESRLSEALYLATDEVAMRGGFTRENVPSLSHIGVPYWFYEGKQVNVPSADVMEDMLAREVERNVLKAFRELREGTRRDLYSFGSPRVTIALEDEGITATMDLPVRIASGDETVGTDMQFTAHIPVRLRLLHDIAMLYVRNYTAVRSMEDSLFDSIVSDPRIPSPFGQSGQVVPCDRGKRYPVNAFSEAGLPFSERSYLVEPFREHARMAAANELRRIRQADFSEVEAFVDLTGGQVREEMRHIEWSFELAEGDLEFSFLANHGQAGYESNHTIYFQAPAPVALTRPTRCLSGYQVDYTVHFPVKIVIRDLLPTAKLVGARGSAIKPLEFKFYMGPYLRNEWPATAPSVEAPPTIDDECQGSCSLTVELDPPDIEGTLTVGPCRYPSNENPMTYSSGTTWRGIPCGVHDVVLDADNPGYARTAAESLIGSSTSLTLTVKKHGSVTGKVFMNYTVYCPKAGAIREWVPEPLVYIDGSPPAYIEVFLAPMDTALGDMLPATVDASGSFKIPRVNPGMYLLLAMPSKDVEGRPMYEVIPYGRIVEIDGGPQELASVVMKPYTMMRDKHGAFHPVAYRDPSC